MSCFSLVTAFSVLLVAAQSDGMGTNGAGEERNWTPINGQWGGSVRGAFFSVDNGNAWLSFRSGYHVEWPVGQKRIMKVDGNVNNLVCVPLATLSANDRRWIEEKNPLETCLCKTSNVGAVGTLSPKLGSYRVQDIVGERALIEYVVNDKPVWTFWLRSNLVPLLKTSERYEAISPRLVKDFDRLPESSRERYCIDFRIVKKQSQTKKGKCGNEVEDNR